MVSLVLGIISLVFAILGFFVAPIWGPIIAIVLGIIAFVKGKNNKDLSSQYKAGFVTGLIGFILGIVSLIVGIVLVAMVASATLALLGVL